MRSWLTCEAMGGEKMKISELKTFGGEHEIQIGETVISNIKENTGEIEKAIYCFFAEKQIPTALAKEILERILKEIDYVSFIKV